jgi:CubicO group peptidase (beta-lactamase class C family)
MNRTLRTVVVILILVTSVTSAAPVHDGQRRIAPSRALTPAAIDTLRSRIRRLMAAGKVPSMAVAVARQGRIVWEEGFGLADVEHGVAATPTTVYSVASITKPMTATALMTLVERGKVDLDRPANDYLGTPGITGLAGDAAGATVRRVLSHSSGLPVYSRTYYANDSTAHADLDRAIARYAILTYPPGRVYEYSNLGFGIIQRIIERVSGRRYEDVMRDEVFGPLGMTATTIGTGQGIAHAAVRYSPQGTPLPFYDMDHRGASLAWTSAHDLIRFAMFLLRDHARGATSVITDRSVLAMQHVETPGDSTQGYGLGIEIDREGTRTLVMHNGSMPGVDATLRMYPAEDVAFVVLSNSENEATGQIADAIRDAMLAPAPAPAAPAASDTTVAKGPQPFAAPAALLGEWVGSVRTYDGTKIPLAMRVKADDVHVRLGGPGTFTTVLNAPRWISGIQVLTGVFAATIPSEDTNERPHFVAIALWFDGEKLMGRANAVLTERGGEATLPAYAELSRRKPAGG